MKVLVLAAGRSKRIKPIEDKTLLKFNGKSLICHCLDNLSRAGVTDFIVMTGKHNREAIIAETTQLPYQVQVLEQENLEEGMAGAIKSAANSLKGESVLIVSSNDVVEQNLLDKFIQRIATDNPEALMVGKTVKEYFPGGYLKLDKNGYVQSIVEKPGAGNEPSDLINLVFHYFKDADKLIKEVQSTKSTKDDIYEVALQNLINKDLKIKVYPYNGQWFAIKYPWHVLQVARYMHSKIKGQGISPKAHIHGSAVISGEVVIEEGAKVDANAVIKGPAYIGKNTIVGVNSFIRDSYINDNCVIGFNSEITRTYMHDYVWTHNNYIGDSIIGSNVSFGGGSVTGNLRLDEKNVVADQPKLGLITGNDIRVGINTSFMPGVTIGSNSMIGAGLILAEEVPPNSFVKMKSKLVIRPNTKQVPKR